MSARSTGDRQVLDAFERWLGTDLFDGDSATDYLTAFHDITTASLGVLPGDADRVAIGWGAFEAYLDGYATFCLRSLLPGRARRRVHRRRPSAADPPGFVSSEMIAAVPINTASFDELRKVPGIGARLATRVVEERERLGPFTRLGQLASVPGFTREAYQLAAPYLTARPRQAPIAYPELENLPCIGFPEYIRFLHDKDMLVPGHECSTGSLRLATLAVQQMCLAAASARSAPYWQKHRNADATTIRLRQQDLVREQSWVRVDNRHGRCKVAPVTNSSYLTVLRNLIDSATEKICISVHMMKLGSRKLTAEVLDPLIAASARQVKVRILLDREQATLREADRGALTRLLESGVPVRYNVNEPMMHRKALIFDQGCLLVGSHNLTPNSIFRSEELSLFVQNGELARSEGVHFDDLWNASKEGQAEGRR